MNAITVGALIAAVALALVLFAVCRVTDDRDDANF